MTTATITQVYDFVKSKKYPVHFQYLRIVFPGDRQKLRSRCARLVKQGYLKKVDGDSYIVSEAFT